jgi:DNA-binding beta-propeller fold protein YncE
MKAKKKVDLSVALVTTANAAGRRVGRFAVTCRWIQILGNGDPRERAQVAIRGLSLRAVQSIAAKAARLWAAGARWRWVITPALAAVAVLASSGSAWASSSVYVTDEGFNHVEIYPVGAGGALSLGGNVETGALPVAVAVRPDGRSAYVVNYSAGTVSQYDDATSGFLYPKAPPAVSAGSFPSALAVSPDGTSVYVTNAGNGTVSQYDVGAGGVLSPKAPATVNAGSSPLGVAASPDGKSVYVANSSDGTVSQHAVGAGGVLSPKTPMTINAGTGPEAVAVSPDDTSVYVLNRGGTVSQYSVGAGGVLSAKNPATVGTGAYPTAIAVSPDGRNVYVTNQGNGSLGSAGTVSQYDVGPGGVLSAKTPATVGTGSNPFGVAVSPDGKSVYVTNDHDNTVSQYDVGAGGGLSAKSPAIVGAGSEPYGVAALPDQGPVAAFGVSGAPAGSATGFDGSAASDPDGTVARYDWDFGDGTTAVNAGPMPAHTYGAPGSYTARLTVTDDAGCSTGFVFTGQTASCVGTAAATTTRAVTVPPTGSPLPSPLSLQPTRAPRAAFSFSPTGPICAGQEVTFDASDSTPGSTPITHWFWQFADSSDLATVFGNYYWHSNGGWRSYAGWYPGPRVYVLDQTPYEPHGFAYPDVISSRYDYEALASSESSDQPFAEAVLGTTVTLTVENASGLTDSVTHTVPVAYPYFTFASAATFGFPHCHRIHDQVTDLPRIPGGSGVTLEGTATVGVPLDCGGGTLCGGLVTMSTVLGSGGRTARAARVRRQAPVVGQERFALTPGHHATINVALNRRGRALARSTRLHKLRVTVTTVHFGRGKGKTTSRVLTVRRAKQRATRSRDES